jgi:hypothetical protein
LFTSVLKESDASIFRTEGLKMKEAGRDHEKYFTQNVKITG